MSRKTQIALVCLGCLAGALGASAAGAAESDDVAQLLKDVHQIPVIGAPGAIIPFGPQAIPLVVGQVGERHVAPVVAASRLDKGRIVAFSHNGYFGAPSGDWKQLLFNSVKWAGGGRRAKKSDACRVLVYRQNDLLTALQAGAAQAIAADAKTWRNLLKQCDVICVESAFDNRPELADAVRQFVRDGGGLVTAGTGWGWASLNPGKELTDDYLGNRVLMPAGLVVSDVMPSGTGGRFGVHDQPPRLASAWEALVELRSTTPKIGKANQADMIQASWILQAAAKALPLEDAILWPELRKIVKTSHPLPAPGRPIAENDVLARIAVAVEDAEMARLPPDKIKAHPAAVGFPFAVPAEAKPTTAKREIDTTIPAWHSLGLYAAPGAIITIKSPTAALGAKLAVRIGCHTDQLWNFSKWERWPNLARRAEITRETTRIANPFGGLVYIDVPDHCDRGTIQVTIVGAVESPLYELDKTDSADWIERIRKLPGPWAELACPGIIVTVPSRAIRDLDDPKALMEFWNRAVALEDSLAMYKPGDRKRPERFVADQQISAGYMHSGYPIMCGPDVYDVNVSIAKLRGTASKPGGWGHWHEVGHNHQSKDWTPSNTGEVTVNLFTMYVINQFYGLPLDQTRPNDLSRERRLTVIRDYLASNRNAEDWGPFEGLLLYFQLVDAFGWEPLKQVFEEYRRLGPNEHPKSDAERWDQWMVRYSRAVNKNLGPFFGKWKVPVTEPSLASIRSLPAWMHADFEAIK